MTKVFQKSDQRIKFLAYLITIAGAVPFYIALVSFIIVQVHPFYSFCVIVYSGLIITFVCGSNWIIILSASNFKKINLTYYLFFIINSKFFSFKENI